MAMERKTTSSLRGEKREGDKDGKSETRRNMEHKNCYVHSESIKGESYNTPVRPIVPSLELPCPPSLLLIATSLPSPFFLPLLLLPSCAALSPYFSCQHVARYDSLLSPTPLLGILLSWGGCFSLDDDKGSTIRLPTSQPKFSFKKPLLKTYPMQPRD